MKTPRLTQFVNLRYWRWLETSFLFDFQNDLQHVYRPFHGYICLAVCLLGCPANIITVRVLASKDMRDNPINKILTSIALLDFLLMLEYITFIFPMYILSEQSKVHFKQILLDNVYLLSSPTPWPSFFSFTQTSLSSSTQSLPGWLFLLLFGDLSWSNSQLKQKHFVLWADAKTSSIVVSVRYFWWYEGLELIFTQTSWGWAGPSSARARAWS